MLPPDLHHLPVSYQDIKWKRSNFGSDVDSSGYCTPVITALCFWKMDAIESWCSETGGLSYHEPKANTWHPLVWICYERGSRHLLTAAVHKGSYKSEETLSLWPRQAYGSGYYISQPRHDRAQDSLAPGEDNQVVRKNAGWSRSPRAQSSLILTLGVLRPISQHGGRYDPSTVKRSQSQT